MRPGYPCSKINYNELNYIYIPQKWSPTRDRRLVESPRRRVVDEQRVFTSAVVVGLLRLNHIEYQLYYGILWARQRRRQAVWQANRQANTRLGAFPQNIHDVVLSRRRRRRVVVVKGAKPVKCANSRFQLHQIRCLEELDYQVFKVILKKTDFKKNSINFTPLHH